MGGNKNIGSSSDLKCIKIGITQGIRDTVQTNRTVKHHFQTVRKQDALRNLVFRLYPFRNLWAPWKAYSMQGKRNCMFFLGRNQVALWCKVASWNPSFLFNRVRPVAHLPATLHNSWLGRELRWKVDLYRSLDSHWMQSRDERMLEREGEKIETNHWLLDFECLKWKLGVGRG